MITITQVRERCIGCNYCVELAPAYWRMSKKDGKSVLIGSREKKGCWSIKAVNEDLDENIAAAEACPVNIIKVHENSKR